MNVLKAAAAAALSSGSKDRSMGSGGFLFFLPPPMLLRFRLLPFPSISISRREKECQQKLKKISVGTVEHNPIRTACSVWSSLHAPLRM